MLGDVIEYSLANKKIYPNKNETTCLMKRKICTSRSIENFLHFHNVQCSVFTSLKLWRKLLHDIESMYNVLVIKLFIIKMIPFDKCKCVPSINQEIQVQKLDSDHSNCTIKSPSHFNHKRRYYWYNSLLTINHIMGTFMVSKLWQYMDTRISCQNTIFRLH